jgi:hypothetical protein
MLNVQAFMQSKVNGLDGGAYLWCTCKDSETCFTAVVPLSPTYVSDVKMLHIFLKTCTLLFVFMI